MTKQIDNEELPTVYKEVRCPKCNESYIRPSGQQYFGQCKRQTADGECSETLETLDKLVRRQHIEQLIRDLIENHEEDHVEVMQCEDESHDHELEESMIVGRKQALEELLEEVQNQ